MRPAASRAGGEAPATGARWGAALLLCLSLAPALPAPGAGQDDPHGAHYAGRSLTETLLALREQGLRIVFTSGVVSPDLRVTTEPEASTPRGILDELLAPHGLTVTEGPGGTLVVVPVPAAAGSDPRAWTVRGTVRSRPDDEPVAGVEVVVLGTGQRAETGADGGFVLSAVGAGSLTLEFRRLGYAVERLNAVEVTAGRDTELLVLLDPLPVAAEEIVVTPSRVSLLRRQPAAAVALSRRDILNLPHLGDDFFRALSLLPGIAGNDASAEFHVRGGRRDETRILIDGQELYESYHLQDFDSALSVIAPATLESVDLSTGGFTAEHGDRMGGVLDMRTLTPDRRRFQLGASLLNAHLGGSGTFDRQRGGWMLMARRGSIDLARRLLGDEDPSYWDAFGKISHQPAPHHGWRANVLASQDRLDLFELDEDTRKEHRTAYDSLYFWLSEQSVAAPDLLVETAASVARIDRDRRGLELDEDVRFTIADRRRLDVLALRQQWDFQASPGHLLRWGFETRKFDTDYDYASEREFDSPLALLRGDLDEEEILFRDRFAERHTSLYASDRAPLTEALTLELGLRYDRHTQTAESHLSPRFNLAWSAGERSLLRAAWGRYLQSQRPYELQVEDGQTAFQPVERSEHRVLGVEHRFRSRSGRPGPTVRAEVYQRRVQNPRVRFENLYEPLNTFPEVEPDRVAVIADRSYAEGVEIFVRSRLGERAEGWVNYTWSTTEDELDGRRQRRRFDQTHSLSLDLNLRLPKSWNLNLAWRLHSGWPTTPLTLQIGEDEEGDPRIEPVLGAPYSERLAGYHRLDLRASRAWRLSRGKLELFLDVQNLYNRRNAAGFDYSVDEETGELIPTQEEWPGFLPSVGLSFEF